MTFYDDDHKRSCYMICSRMKHLDCYHLALSYLLSLDTMCREHVEDVFDFQQDGIKVDGLNRGWQTGTSMRTTRLAFNLWNGYCYGENDMPSYDYTPEALLVCGDYAPYYLQAMQIRFEREGLDPQIEAAILAQKEGIPFKWDYDYGMECADPFDCESPCDYEFDPYVYDGTMSPSDHKRALAAYEAEH